MAARDFERESETETFAARDVRRQTAARADDRAAICIQSAVEPAEMGQERQRRRRRKRENMEGLTSDWSTEGHFRIRMPTT
jgi:hypothetical protein